MPEWLKAALCALFFGACSLLILFHDSTPFRDRLMAVLGFGMSVGGVIAAWIAFQRHREYVKRPQRACFRCYYDLRSTSSPLCPECGADQNDPNRFR